jgi:hypothetical protein
MGGFAASELTPFLGPRPGWTYVYGRVDDGTRGGRVVVSGLAQDDSGALVIHEAFAIPSAPSRTGFIESSRECRLWVRSGDLVQSTPDGDVVVLLRAPLRVGTTWTRPVVGYAAESGPWRGEIHCRIAMIESVPLFGETRVTVRVLGKARLPVGEAVLVEQHAAGIGLVLRREQVGDLAAYETVLEEIREEPDSPPS